MFIRIVRDRVYDSMYQCDRFHTHPVKDNPTEFTITMEIDGRANAVSTKINKNVPEALGVYIMNDHGRTIDTLFRKEEGSL